MMSPRSSHSLIPTPLQQTRSARSADQPVSWVSAAAAIALLGGGLCGFLLGRLAGVGTVEHMQVIGVLCGLVTALGSRIVGDLSGRAPSASTAPLSPVPGLE